MDESTRYIQDEVHQRMLFADDIILIDETCMTVNARLKVWIQTLESKGFNDVNHEACEEVRFGTQVISKKDSFKYTDSIIQKSGDIK
ncbi:hypothetical protein H5410_050545 [Solanum commersonii]|uniref:Reverse transcriptase domain-containing protein n=1 Tax=Solanum commersonii TaxID=4109 RepID=A0A9J5WY80_SOLCO|nr:hypothetical protein H5410_050545 [Solanum commersonii]